MSPHPLLLVSLRQQALYVPGDDDDFAATPLRDDAATLLANLHRLGFTVDQSLRHALNHAAPEWLDAILTAIRAVRRVDVNWAPLVKGWGDPTNERWSDHVHTWFAQIFGAAGTTLPCGHLIPDGTFPLARYNGCPYCGRPFDAAPLTLTGDGQASRRKVLTRWRDADVAGYLASLLGAQTALDASQRDSLGLLLGALGLPDAAPIAMKETRLLVIDALVKGGRADEAQWLFDTPADVLRYLWFAHTGHTQVILPRVLKRGPAGGGVKLLRYPRPMCQQVARWLERLPIAPEAGAEVMHPKRRLWARLIRALRLTEYAKRPGHPRLAELLRRFHTRDYFVHAGAVQRARLAGDAPTALRLLEQRPGVFARSLFADMLRFGPELTLASFARVADETPLRLLFSLNAYAEDYFVVGQPRFVRPLGGTPRQIPPNARRRAHLRESLNTLPAQVEALCLGSVRARFARHQTDARTLYIAPELFKLPVAIGERSETVQDLPAALMGTRFPVEGDKLRLFMQWGVGLSARHLDMDLSCRIAYPGREEICAFYALSPVGCRHSGDIRYIPDQVGTAEYIELDLPTLSAAGARYAAFFCNAFSLGGLSPNLVVGWMNSAHPMHISPETGVAYDPSCVQHQVRVTQSLRKGLLFGLLDLAAREVVWFEVAVAGQLAAAFDLSAAERLLAKLDARLTIGKLLMLKAEAQGLAVVASPGADEDYTVAWARDAAAVTALLAG